MQEMVNALLSTWHLFLFSLALATVVSTVQGCFTLLRNWLWFEDHDIIPMLFLSFAVTLSFGILGVVLGYLSGLSREPVVGVVLPALLTLIAAVSVYVVGQSAEFRMVVLNIVVSISIALVVGVTAGSVERERFAFAQREVRLKSLLDPKFQADVAVREAQINAMRRALNLPAKPIDFEQPDFGGAPTTLTPPG